jgi:hypothetical protein
MEILVFANVSELDGLEEVWEHLSEQQTRIVPTFSQLRQALQDSGAKFRLLAASDDGRVVGMACFVYGKVQKRYGIAERRLFSLPVTQVMLVGSCVLGPVDEHVITKFFELMLRETDFDIFNLGEIIIDTPLYRAITTLRGETIVGRVVRQNTVRWLIKLPKSFDEYCKSLGAATRKKDVGKFKRFQQRPSFEPCVINRPEQVDKFLADGEKLSRLTYQWNFGQRLLNDEATRQHFVQLAKLGQLRCYMLYFEGQPCAFAYGLLSRGIYLWETSGYDPRYLKDSPGTALMLWMIRDLIENTDCRVFDFGMGGNYEYKARFGNTSLDCTWLQIGRWTRPYSVFLIASDYLLNGAKNFIARLVGSSEKLMKQLKRATRKYGDNSRQVGT